MGNEQSVQKAITSAKKRKDTSLVFRGDSIDQKWIPEEDISTLKLEIVKLIDMRFLTVPPVLYLISTIKQLDLSENMLVSVTGIGSLVNLTDLDLSGNQLDYLPDDLAQCKKLAFLNISKNMLTIRSLPPAIFDGRAFSSLDISENKFIELTIELMDLLIACESVAFHSNPWNTVELQSLLPSSADEQIKTLLKVLKSNIVASGLTAASSGNYVPLANKEVGRDPSFENAKTAAPRQPSISQDASVYLEADDSVVPIENIQKTLISKHRSDSITKRISLSLSKQSSNTEEDVLTPTLKLDSESAKDSTPPAIPPPRVDATKSSTADGPPPPVSKSPAAAAPPPPPRTQEALKTHARPSGPKGRKLPSTDFIDSISQEESITIIAKDGKSEIPVTFATKMPISSEGPPPLVPSKTSRPPASSSQSPIRDNFSINHASNRPTLVKELSANTEEGEDVVANTNMHTIASPPPPKPSRAISTFGASASISPSLSSSKQEEPVFKGHRGQKSDSFSIMQRQNTLTDNSKFELPESAAADLGTRKASKKPPVGGVSMFGGGVPVSEESEKPVEAAESIKKPDLPKKMDSHQRDPSGKTKSEPVKPAIISQLPTVSANSTNVPATMGKKPPVGGVSMFGGPPPVSSEPSRPDLKEEPPTPKKPGVFSIFSNPYSPTETKDIPSPKEKEVPAYLPKKPEVSSQLPTKKPPVGGVSMFGGPPIDETLGGGASNSGSFKKPPPGAVSMFGGAAPQMHSKNLSPPPSLPVKHQKVTSSDNLSTSTDLSTSELRERLKHQLSNNQVDSAKPMASTLPRGFKPSGMETTANPPLPLKPTKPLSDH